MRRIQLLFALLATMTVVHGQRDTVRKYLDAGLHFTSKRNMVFAALAIRAGDHWLLLAVYPDTSLLARVYFKNEELTIKDGPYTIYSRGNKVQDGNFINNVAEGGWQSWHTNGLPQDSGQIKHNYFIGQWKHWHKNGQLKVLNEYSGAAPPPTGAPQEESDGGLISGIHIDGVLNGPWQSWYANGALESSGVYSNDSISGVWKWFREDGTPSSVETYTNRKITQLECYDEKGALSGSTCSILKPPVFTHPFFSPLDFIMDQLYRVYNISLKDEDQINIDFTITKEGKITNLDIKNIRSTAIKSTIMRIIEKMPAWSPAISHNRVIDGPVSLTIN